MAKMAAVAADVTLEAALAEPEPVVATLRY